MIVLIQVLVKAGPSRCASDPNICSWDNRRWVVQSAQADDCQAGTSRRVREQMRTTMWAKLAVDDISAVTFTREHA
jgi:hypothetical protein